MGKLSKGIKQKKWCKYQDIHSVKIIMEKLEIKKQVCCGKGKKRKIKNWWWCCRSNKLSSAVREIIPKQINSCENAFDDDAELHGDIDNFHESVSILLTDKNKYL